jgi:hypothetical protein
VDYLGESFPSRAKALELAAAELRCGSCLS